MDTIREIIEIAGYDSAEDMPAGDVLEIEGGPAFMNLEIMKVGFNSLIVAHYFEQNGDRMADPKIEFNLTDHGWDAIRYKQDPYMHQYDPTGLPDVNEFAEQWGENLYNQNFIERAREKFDDGV